MHGAGGGQRRHGLLQRLVRRIAAAAAAAQIRCAQILAAQNSLREAADASPSPSLPPLPLQAVQLHDALPGGHVAPLLRAVRRVPVVAGLPAVPARLVVRAAAADRTRARCPSPRRRHTPRPHLSSACLYSTLLSPQPAPAAASHLYRYCCKIEGATPGDDYKIETSPCKCHRYGC